MPISYREVGDDSHVYCKNTHDRCTHWSVHEHCINYTFPAARTEALELRSDLFIPEFSIFLPSCTNAGTGTFTVWQSVWKYKYCSSHIQNSELHFFLFSGLFKGLFFFHQTFTLFFFCIGQQVKLQKLESWSYFWSRLFHAVFNHLWFSPPRICSFRPRATKAFE